MDTSAIIQTARLVLVRLTDTSEGSQHVQWFHENWSDDAATAWSKATKEDLGEHVGSVSLRRQEGGPTLPPPNLDIDDVSKSVNLRVIGYAFFKQHWGKGYATEAGRALVDAYTRSVAEEMAKGKELFYLEAGVDEGNPGSENVLQKIGFQKVGWKEETESVFLAGEWREPGYWIYGKYL
ncbi:GNAT domain-containing protein [Pyrenochaeta sp. MPI-SDFR-AT-0127]|nr:GNAT domain-containing protein [Pyrenochaeta sp. MPI-SDFR-AT-0127]